MALASLIQDDFGGGMYRGRKAPANAVYDAINALVNDEGLLFKRGGSAYRVASNANAALVGLQTMTLPLYGSTVVAWSTTKLYVIDSVGAGDISDQTPATLPRSFARGVGAGSALYIPAASGAGNVVKITDGSPIPLATNVTLTGSGAVVGYLAAVGAPARLVATYGNRAYFSGRGTPETFTSTDYHELPQNAQIIGADSIDDNAILLTTAGVYAISNMALDPVDDFGNVQHQVAQVNKDLILWGDPGIASWRGALILPALDDIYLFGLEAAPQPITGGRGNPYDGGIRDLYRSYVKAGYQPGIAVAHRGHYFLPVLNGTTLVDVLVCRLDHGFAWTRWSGHAAGGAYAQQVGSSTRSPKLYGINDKRITDLTATFDPTSANAVEADASVHDCTITSRDYPTGGNQHGFVKRFRARYELTDGGTPDPTVAVAYSSDQDAGSFTTLTDKGLQGGGTGGLVSDGAKYNWWLVGKRRERIRFRVTATGASASFVLRSVELLLRPTGKQ